MDKELQNRKGDGTITVPFRTIVTIGTFDECGLPLCRYDEGRLSEGAYREAFIAETYALENIYKKEIGGLDQTKIVELMSEFVNDGHAYSFPKAASPVEKSLIFFMAKARSSSDIQGFIDRYCNVQVVDPEKCTGEQAGFAW